MLSPDQRTVAMDMPRPPAGYRIDQAVLTTYTLDLDVPLAVLAHFDRGRGRARGRQDGHRASTPDDRRGASAGGDWLVVVCC
jgi:hypothetical protein